jgi:transcriptional regulator with XRE-family HTH domain
VQQKRRSKNPILRAFGERLTDLRGERSREQVSKRLRSLGVPLGGSTLAQYEKGTVWSPDPGVLWGLSEIYKVPMMELVNLLRVTRAHPTITDPNDLPRHELLGESAPQSGGPMSKLRLVYSQNPRRKRSVRSSHVPRPSSNLANTSKPTGGQSLGDKMQLLAIVRPHALKILESVVDRLLVDAG